MDRTSRNRLLEILEALAVLDTEPGRTLLLQDLPPNLVNTIARDGTKRIDLLNIVSAAERWSPQALRTVIETAHDLVSGSSHAAALQALLDSLPAGAIAPLAGESVPAGERTAAGPDVSAEEPPPTPAQRRHLRLHLYIFAFAAAIGISLFVHYVGNRVLARSPTAWIYVATPELADYIIGGLLALLPALAAAWIVRRLRWVAALAAGAYIALAVFKVLFVTASWFGGWSDFALLLLNSLMIAGGVLVTIYLLETLQTLYGRGAGEPKL